MKRLLELHSKMCGVLLFGAILFPSIVFAEDVSFINFYGNNSIQSILLDDVDKITFSDNAVDVRMTDKTVISVLYNDLKKIAFGEKEQTSAVKSVKNEFSPLLSISYQAAGQTVVVESSFLIESVSIYNMQGRLMYQLSPHAEITTMSLADYPSGIYIVNVSNVETVKSQKIIKY